MPAEFVFNISLGQQKKKEVFGNTLRVTGGDPEVVRQNTFRRVEGLLESHSHR